MRSIIEKDPVLGRILLILALHRTYCASLLVSVPAFNYVFVALPTK